MFTVVESAVFTLFVFPSWIYMCLYSYFWNWPLSFSIGQIH